MDTNLPSELQQPSFKATTFGGYDKKEVQRFLAELSKEWIRVQETNRNLELQLADSKTEVSRLHRIEEELLRELSRLKDERSALIRASEEESRIEVMKGRMKADKIVMDAKDKAEMMIRDAQEKYQLKMDLMRHELQTLESNYNVVQSHTDVLIREMMDMMDQTLDKISRLTSTRKIATLEDKLLKTHQVLNALSVKKALNFSDSSEIETKEVKRTRISSRSSLENGTLAQEDPQPSNGKAAGARTHNHSNVSFFDQVTNNK